MAREIPGFEEDFMIRLITYIRHERFLTVVAHLHCIEPCVT